MQLNVASVQKTECPKGYLSEDGGFNIVSGYITCVSFLYLTVAFAFTTDLNYIFLINAKIARLDAAILNAMTGTAKLIT